VERGSVSYETMKTVKIWQLHQLQFLTLRLDGQLKQKLPKSFQKQVIILVKNNFKKTLLSDSGMAHSTTTKKLLFINNLLLINNNQKST